MRPVAMLLVLAGLAWSASEAERAYEEGVKAEKSGRSVRAYILYSQAAALDPKNQLYALKARNLKMLATNSVKVDVAVPKTDPTDEERFQAITGALTDQEMKEVRQLKEPPRLDPPVAGTRDFKLKLDPKALWEKVASDFGLFVIFDRDYAPQGPVKFEVAGVDYRVALHALEDATQTFAVPLSDRVLLVADDSQQKRTELETNEAVGVPIPDRTSVQEAQELAMAVQQTMEIRRFVLDPAKRMVYFRDRVSKVEAARAILQQLMHAKPQVDIEVEMLSVTSSSSLSWGLNLPTQFPLVYFGNIWKNAVVNIPAGFTNFLTFGGGKTLFGIGVTNAELFATASRTSGSSILNSHIRVSDGQAGSLHVGDKYPIVTGTYGGYGMYAPPQVNFEDLGVVMKVTPTVHGPDEVTLKVEAEYKVLGGAGLNGIPIISGRKFDATVRLKTSEYAVVAGLVTEQKSETKSGMVGLSRIPLLGYLFRQTTRSHDEGQILLVIKPRILNLPPTEFATREFYLGSETRPVTPL